MFSRYDFFCPIDPISFIIEHLTRSTGPRVELCATWHMVCVTAASRREPLISEVGQWRRLVRVSHISGVLIPWPTSSDITVCCSYRISHTARCSQAEKSFIHMTWVWTRKTNCNRWVVYKSHCWGITRKMLKFWWISDTISVHWAPTADSNVNGASRK